MQLSNHVVKWMIVPKNVFLLSLIIILICIPAIPAGGITEYIVGSVLIQINIFSVFAASWDLTAGVAGQFSFGQALFFCIAGYVSAALNIYFGLPPLLTIPMGGAFGVLASLILGLPSLRVKGPYFVIVTLLFPTILVTAINAYSEGVPNLSGVSPISNDVTTDYYASVLLMLVSIFILLRILSSRLGLIFRSIREDEDTAEATGINTTKYKLLAWAISGFFAGIAGGFFTHYNQYMSLTSIQMAYSFQAILFAVIGGMGTIIGSVGGAYLMIILTELLRYMNELRNLIFAATLIAVTLFIPFGLYRWFAARFDIQIGTWSGLKQLRRKKLDGSNP